MENGFPADIMLEICRRVGASNFRNLKGVMFASSLTRKLAESDAVLKVANIEEFKRRAWQIQEGTVQRAFFKRCVDANNNTALALEGLRVAFNIGDLDGAIKMIHQTTEHNSFSIYTLAMLQICSGEYETGMETLKGLHLEYEGISEADLIAKAVCEAVSQMRPRRQGSFQKSYICPKPICDCQFVDGIYDYAGPCYDCFVYWHSSILVNMS